MATIIKQFNNDFHMQAFELRATIWLKEHVGEFVSTTNLVNSIHRTEAALKYRIARGSHWDKLKYITHVFKTVGTGWQMFAALVNYGPNELVIIIDDEMLALQFKLAVQ